MAQSVYKVGSKIKIEVTTYPLNYELSKKFLKGSHSAKQKEAKSLKEDFAEGKIKPNKVSIVEYNVVSVQQKDGRTEVTMKMVDPTGGNYTSTVEFGKDSVYVHRCMATTPMKVKEDTVGLYYAGTEVLPNTLNVGDVTPGYSDLMAMFPVEKKDRVKMFFNVHDAVYSYSGYVHQNFTETATSSMLTLTQSGKVKEKTRVSIGNTTADAYVIGSEVWVKYATEINFKQEQQNYFRTGQNGIASDIRKKNQEYFDDAGQTVQDKIDDITGANEYGYVVKYKEEWYAPQYGMPVKTNNYDNYGLLQTVTKLISID